MQKKKNLSNRQIRRALNKKGIPCVRFFPRLRCRKEAKKSGNVHWLFAEDYGFVILNHQTVELFNRGRMKHGFKKLRVRDMDRLAVYRYPKKAFIYQRKRNDHG